VVEFQVVPEGTRLVLLLVGRGAAPGLEERVRAGVEERLAALGVRDVTIEARRCEALQRPASGKLALVVAESRALASV
jgi:hypothetical protein